MPEAYSRLYHRFPSEFDAVWKDDHALATWTRLLLLADASWPMRPPVPRSVRPKPLAVLVDAGLVVVTGDCYTIRGLDAERTRRSDAGRSAVEVRWKNARNTDVDTAVLPRRDETRRDEITPPPQVGRRENGTNPRATGTNPRAMGTSPRQKLAAEKRDPTSIHDILSRVNRT